MVGFFVSISWELMGPVLPLGDPGFGEKIRICVFPSSSSVSRANQVEINICVAFREVNLVGSKPPRSNQKQDIERGQDYFYIFSLSAYEKCKKAKRRGLYK